MEIRELIGESVNHKISRLGDGVITDAFEKDQFKYIKVFFPSEEKDLTFVFPSVFTENELLTSESEIVNKAISEAAPVKPAVPSPAVKPKPKPKPSLKDGSSGTYARFEREYPNHAVIMREGAFYSAHNDSAYVLAHAMDYKIGIDMYGRPSTGGPDASIIEAGLKAVGFSFVIVEDRQIVTRFDGRDPFLFLNLKEASDLRP